MLKPSQIPRASIVEVKDGRQMYFQDGVFKEDTATLFDLDGHLVNLKFSDIVRVVRRSPELSIREITKFERCGLIHFPDTDAIKKNLAYRLHGKTQQEIRELIKGRYYAVHEKHKTVEQRLRAKYPDVFN